MRYLDSQLFHILLAALNQECSPRTMKVALGILLGVFCAVSSFAQGTIHFANTATTLLSTNSGANPAPGQQPNTSGLTTGLDHYRIGLYIAPLGTVDLAAFTLVLVATNGTIPVSNGRFDGGLAALATGNTTVSFQVRAWTLTEGPTYESFGPNSGSAYRGRSTIGFVTPAVGGAEIFGTNPGQVSGFSLFSPVPEPSTPALMLLGLGCGMFLIRRAARVR